MGLIMHTLSIFLIFGLLSSFTNAANFNVVNNCGYTVWAAATPGGGIRLDPSGSWSFDVAADTASGRVWGRTGCNFDASGNGKCATGDCNSKLDCTGSSGEPPFTIAEYTLSTGNGDTIDISLVDGFNIPMEFSPTTPNGDKCKAITCAGTSILDQCPSELKAANGGCNSACTVFKTEQYCCTNDPNSCGPTTYSEFFKTRCPDAYSYAKNDGSSTFYCTSGTNYKVTFCP